MYRARGTDAAVEHLNSSPRNLMVALRFPMHEQGLTVSCFLFHIFRLPRLSYFAFASDASHTILFCRTLPRCMGLVSLYLIISISLIVSCI